MASQPPPRRSSLPAVLVPDSGLVAQPVTPASDERRHSFDCGSRPFELEVREAIRHATWFSSEPSLRAIRFDRGDEAVGYAVMAVERWEHPTWKSRPDVILRHVTEGIAPRYPQVAGVIGIVRVGNAPAIDLLVRHGFAPDEAGSFSDRLTGAPSLLYRFLVPGRT